jgi:hypothetical protein
MTRQFLALTLSFFVTTAAFAAAQIQSVTPSSAPARGGLEITILGSGFTHDAKVIFGSAPAAETRFVNASTLIAVTPPHLPETTFLWVMQPSGSAYAQFTFHGEVPSAFERVLLPTFTDPVQGAFGSLFQTSFRAASRTGRTVQLHGLERPCQVTCIRDGWLAVERGVELEPHHVVYDGTPGRFIYVPQDDIDSLTATLRVHDVTRAHENFGTEIPIVREREFVHQTESILLLGVPIDERFRNTLRVYSQYAFPLLITVEGEPTKTVQMHGGSNIFEPAYAVFSDFPVGTGTRNVTVEYEGTIISADARKPFWAFVTATNNDTQLISTITP